VVLVSLGPRMRLVEADSTWDFRSYAVVTKARSIERTTFSSLDPGERREIGGPLDWVAYKSRYFATAVLTVDEALPRIGAAIVTGGPRLDKYAKEADLRISLPAPGGQFSYEVYLGPQEVRLLSRVGHDLQDMNPYGWFLRPIIQPIADIVARILVWMHETLRLEYGWVLILFGVAVRLVMWPLNQKAMHSSMAMQAIQPEIKAIQEKHKGDPQRLQQETMKLYREHGVNPLGGCLPMLLPMPVLFALFFVFRETIEFRGVPFLWLPDLSRADPLYIIPIVMGLSMYVVSKLGQRGVPPNPQAKMMLYFMPVMLTVLFFKFAAGLNLYYAVSNISSIPQQWMISEKRLKRIGRKP
jgi:YidC/Oxa1 family membrane protein insertase